MAQNQNFHPEAPAFARSRPDAYYAWLTSNGFPHRVAYDQTTAIFGAPKTPEQIQKEQASANQQAGFAQAGGMIGGAIAAQQIGSLITGGSTAATTGASAAGAGTGAGTGAVAMPTLLGGGGAIPTAGAGAGTTGAGAGAATTTGASSTLGSAGSVALPVAAILAAASNAWETGMKDIVRGRGDKADWINQGSNVLFGAAPNLALRLMGKRTVGAMMTSGKSSAQKIRDDFRGDLKEAGVADDQYNVTLADGSKFNIGLDGKTKYQNVGKNIDGKTTRNAWDVDWSNPLGKFATDQIEPMIRNIYGADNKKAGYTPGQFTGILVNAATSNAKNEQEVLANIQAMLGQSKFAIQQGPGSKISTPVVQRAEKGKVVRQSPGLYRDDKGKLIAGNTMRAALENAYNKGKGKSKES